MSFFQYYPPVISRLALDGLVVTATSESQESEAAANVAIAARDLALTYRNDAQFYYEQVQQIQSGDYVTTVSFNNALAAIDFGSLLNIPASFTPAAHSHNWASITGKPLSFSPAAHFHDWTDIENKPASYTPASHSHSWLEISGKPLTYSPSAHGHDWSDITGKPTAYQPTAHNHHWNEINSKPTNFVPTAHGHLWQEISNKPTFFAPVAHTHNWADVSAKPAQATRWPTYTEVTGKPVFSSGAFLDATAAKDDNTIGRLLRVGDFGVGRALELGAGVNIDTLFKSGSYGAFEGAHPSASLGDNPFPNSAGAFSLVVTGDGVNLDDADYSTQTAIRYSTGEYKFRSIASNSGGWSEWFDVLHSGNKNFDVFGGLRAGMIGQGSARSATDAVVYLPINSKKLPSGVTIGADSLFEVRRPTGEAVAQNIASVTFSGSYTERMVRLDVVGLAGLTVGEPLELRTQTAESKITVDY